MSIFFFRFIKVARCGILSPFLIVGLLTMIPANFQLIYSQEQIAQSIARLGKEIQKWAKEIWDDSHTDIVTVPVLRGGIFFFADLVRAVDYSIEISPVKTWGYVNAVNAEKLDKVKIDMSGVPAKGRRVLLIDDICDSGRTLASLKEEFLAAGALEVRSAVLIKRETEEQTFDPEYVAFNYEGPEWFVGYGMEDSERWRNLRSVYIIQQQ